ncbi:MAG: chemotaxis protein CheW [Candidatus Competibacteraceae bacterium]|nr:chemotaxis protein CheW [Candidatus Competibacteraceae bacterium]
MAAESLRCFLMPFTGGGQLLLPNSTLLEVLPFAPPLPLEGAPAWVLGKLLWRARTVPLVATERLATGQRPEPTPRSRIVMVHALGGNPKLPFFGFMATGAPRAVKLEEGDLVQDTDQSREDDEPREGVLNRVKLGAERAVIPDLDRIEEVLVPLVRV